MVKIHLSNGKYITAKLKVNVCEFVDRMGEFTVPIESTTGKVFHISKKHIVAIEEMEEI